MKSVCFHTRDLFHAAKGGGRGGGEGICVREKLGVRSLHRVSRVFQLNSHSRKRTWYRKKSSAPCA